MSKFYPPTYQNAEFHCPNCYVYASQKWGEGYKHPHYTEISPIEWSECSHCDQFSFWYNKKLVIPKQNTVSKPHPLMPDDIKNDYIEASNIVNSQ